MKIYRAVKFNILTQGFGVKGTKPELIPLYNSLGFNAHEGFDWAVNCKDHTVKHGGQCEQVYYDLDIKGTIIGIQKSDEFGFGITARTEDKDGIFEHLWWHFDTINPDLKVGTILESGDLLGVAGNTGRTTGAHLHREMRIMGKDTYGNYYKKEPNNGYKSCIDMTPYFENQFILDVINNLVAQIGIWQKIINVFKLLLGIK